MMIGLVWHRWLIASSPTAALKPGSKPRREQLPHACLIDGDVERITGDRTKLHTQHHCSR